MNSRYILKVAFQLLILTAGLVLSVATTITEPAQYTPLMGVFECDPALDVWSEKARLPRPRISPVCEACDGRIYIIGGRTGRYANHGAPYVETYDPALDQWSDKEWALLPVVDGWSAHCTVGTKIYVMGTYMKNSRERSVYLPAFLEYDTVGDTWSQNPDVPSLGSGAQCVVIGSDFYLACANGLYGVWYSAMEKYDTVAQVWSTCADPPGPPILVDSTMYSVGSWDRYEFTDTVYEYNAGGDTWTQRNSRPSQNWIAVTVAAGGRLYVFCEEGMPVEEYDPASNTWFSKSDAPLFVGRPGLPGRGFAIGGQIYLFCPYGEVAQYDPAADTWTMRTPFPGDAGYGWYYSTANWVLVGGKVYAVGGHISDPPGPYK